MKLKILGICGSATKGSSNELLLQYIKEHYSDVFELSIINNLETLPHFQTELTAEGTPESISYFRKQLAAADGIIISSPEYVFSIPSRLKNALEWCVSTTILTDMPTAIITASASGMKGHEELQLIMKTLQAHITPETSLLFQGIKGKVSDSQLNDELITQIEKLIEVFSPMCSTF
mgnify:CR=1 FL=1